MLVYNVTFYIHDIEMFYLYKWHDVVSVMILFFRVITEVDLVSRLNPGCDYSLFKTGIKPMWEDGKNRDGGRWLYLLSKHQQENLDQIFLQMVSWICYFQVTASLTEKFWTNFFSSDFDEYFLRIFQNILKKRKISLKKLVGKIILQTI